MNRLLDFLHFHLLRFGHIRFEEPIVVIESDDWGKVGGKPDGIYPKEFGTRTDWSYDQLETAEELEKLFKVLGSFKSDFERAPMFTANFIVSNPDVEATRETNYTKLKLKRIDEDFPELIPAWKKGFAEQVFFPQYHGRLHHNFERYQSALRNDDKTRFLFNQGINGGIENFKESKLALYSEYQDFDSELIKVDLADWISEGLNDFREIFGYQSTSTISPNFVCPPKAIDAFENAGVRYLQGCNSLLYVKNGKEENQNFCQGAALSTKITALARNHKFEPCRNRKEWQSEFSIQAAGFWLKKGIPAVLDSHRINYVGTYAENSRKELTKLISSFRSYPNVKFMTSVELGEAIVNQGKYTCVFTGEQKNVTPKDNVLRKQVRNWIN